MRWKANIMNIWKVYQKHNTGGGNMDYKTMNAVELLEENLITMESTKELLEMQMLNAQERYEYYITGQHKLEMIALVTKEIKAIKSHMLTVELQLKQLSSLIRILKGEN